MTAGGDPGLLEMIAGRVVDDDAFGCTCGAGEPDNIAGAGAPYFGIRFLDCHSLEVTKMSILSGSQMSGIPGTVIRKGLAEYRAGRGSLLVLHGSRVSKPIMTV